MASSKGGFNSVASICHGRDTWRIRVRVLRIWEMCPIADLENPFAVQLVLMDAEGLRIEATIRKLPIRKLFGEVVEGNIYRISFFSVVPNVGVYKVSQHEFKILSNNRTRIVPDESSLIPMHGFLFMNSAEIARTMNESEYLIGLVSAVSIRTIFKTREYIF
ncbi:replication protein A 70 kDa DNA-binding subunit C-like [Lotus japonicus]|uniref:replication protein A 70 kDa DNA-binding subunit C-like n=1 Tax=Lotus japonicus TaxID=34305 RepID=UPI00258C279F|nr:replication protein A 70 kDa DNA-binding subunit C-like [Lotus japonicus]